MNGLDACIMQSLARNDLEGSKRCLFAFENATHREISDWFDVSTKLAMRGYR